MNLLLGFNSLLSVEVLGVKFEWNAIEGRKKIFKAWPTKAKKKHSCARLKSQPGTRAPTRVASDFTNRSFQKKQKKNPANTTTIKYHQL